MLNGGMIICSDKRNGKEILLFFGKERGEGCEIVKGDQSVNHTAVRAKEKMVILGTVSIPKEETCCFKLGSIFSRQPSPVSNGYRRQTTHKYGKKTREDKILARGIAESRQP
jgi:hypothetical protein